MFMKYFPYLEDENLPGEDAVSLLLEVEVVRVLEEDLGPAQLVVRLAQHLLADLVARLATVHLVRRGTAVDKVPEYVLLNARIVLLHRTFHVDLSYETKFRRISRGKPYIAFFFC